MMSIKERFVHVLLFQMTAGIFSFLLALFIVERNIIMTISALIIGAIVATSWNWIYNFIFDKIYWCERRNWSIKIRVIHTFLFEIGILLLVTPVYSLCLHISLVEALFLNTSVAAYFLVYTYLFNLCYDKIICLMSDKFNWKIKHVFLS